MRNNRFGVAEAMRCRMRCWRESQWHWSRYTSVAALIFITSTLTYAVPPAPLSNFRAANVDSIWIAQTNRLSKIGIPSGSLLLEITGLAARRLAIDPVRSVVWVYSDQLLYGYSFDGQLKFQVDIAPLVGDSEDPDPEDPSEIENTTHVAVSVDSESGEVWLGLNRDVFRFSPQAALLVSVALDALIVDIAIDETTSRVWWVHQLGADLWDGNSVYRNKILVPHNTRPAAADFDPNTGHLWMATRDVVYRYSETGALLASAPMADINRIASNHNGQLWFADATTLYRMDALSGAVLFELPIFEGNGVIEAIAADRRTGSVWVATNRHLRQIGVDSTQLSSHTTEKPIRSLAAYNDLIPPTLTIIAPNTGAYVATNTPEVVLEYDDIGIGPDPSTIEIMADGEPVTADCTHQPNQSTCLLTQTLAEGMSPLSAIIADYSGNRSEPAGIDVVIDTIAPTITLLAPADGSIINSTSLMIEGQLSEAATLTINGQSVPIGIHHEFAFGPITLVEGENLLVLTATDFAGNFSTLSASMTLDTVPPVVTPPADLTVEAVAAQTVVGLGTATAVDNLDGILLALPDPTGPFALGAHTVVWSATDRAGNTGTATQSVVVQDTTPPILTPPADIEVDSAEKVAVDLGQPVVSDLFEPVAISNDAPSIDNIS